MIGREDKKAGIKEGTFDNISIARYSDPSHWDIGKIYKRLMNPLKIY